MKLTQPQLEELLRLSTGTQNTYGRTRARVQNSLREKGLARLFNADGHKPHLVEILQTFRPVYDRCEITDAGRAALMSDERRFRYLGPLGLFPKGDDYLQDEDDTALEDAERDWSRA